MNDEIPNPEGVQPAHGSALPTYQSAEVDRARNALRDIGTPTAVPEAVSGALIGKRYKLLERIGEGGMGLVWMAEQRSPVRRLVAVKLIKAGMDSAAVLARFDAERQALAMMDHPNIARIFDGGTTDHGHPYFVMELVKGLPLTKYCDERRMPVNERLDLFVQVCSAVQHAHQKGIIHRDLKPGNLLVTEHDGKPVPKVIDFGLAKALGGSSILTDQTLHTSFGAVAGTPQYMAPEQVAINAIDVDTRADIYALGVILYELIAGTTPHELKQFHQAAWEEVRRVIREVDPPKPSLRITQSRTIVNLAATRDIEPARLSKLVAGELDWIVMKALEKDRHRRYGTASELAADLQRHRTGEPVLAAPPTAIYRLRKVARKYRAALTTAVVIVVLLVAGVLTSTWQAIRAGRAEDNANSQTIEANNQKLEVTRQKAEVQKQRDAAIATSKKLEAAAAISRRQLADSYIQNGISSWTEHDPALAALWFSKAIKLDEGDPHRERMDRIRLGDSFRQCVLPTIAPEPTDRWPVNREQSGLTELTKQPDGTLISVETKARLKPDFAVLFPIRMDDLILLCGKEFAQLFDRDTGRPFSPKLSVLNATTAARSPDRRFVAIAGSGGFQILQSNNGIAVPIGDRPHFRSAKFSPDSRLVALSDDTNVQVWNLSTLQPEGSPVIHGETFKIEQVNNNGLLLLSDENSKLRVYNSIDGNAIGPQFNIERLIYAHLLQIGPDGKRLLIQTDANHFSLFDACTGKELYQSAIQSGGLLGFSMDGKWVRNGRLQWDARLTAPASSILCKVNSNNSWSLKMSPDRKMLATYGPYFRLWNVDKLQPISPPYPGEVFDVAFVPNAKEVVVIDRQDGGYHLGVRSSLNGKLLRVGPELREENSFYGSTMSISPDGRYVLVNMPEIGSHVFSVQTLERAAVISGITTRSSANVMPACFSPDSQALVGWAPNGELAAWKTKTGEPIPNPPHAWRALAAPGVLCPDGESYLSNGRPAFRMLGLEDDRWLTPVFPGITVSDIRASLAADGEVVLTSLSDSIRLWDARSAQAVTSALPCNGHTGAVGIDRDEKSAYAFSENIDTSISTLRRWSIAPCQLKIGDAEVFAELISGRKIDQLGGIVPLLPDEYSVGIGILGRLQKESPELFPTSTPSAAPDVLPEYRDEVNVRISSANTPEQKKTLASEFASASHLEIQFKLFKEAELLAKEALSLDESNLAASDHLAHAHACLGQFSDALAVYQKYWGQIYQYGQVGSDLTELDDIWPDGNDDPSFRQLVALRGLPVASSPVPEPTTAPTTSPTNDAWRLAYEAMREFKLGRISHSHELLRNAVFAGRSGTTDSDTASQLSNARALIDPPSTQPTDEFADDLSVAAWDVVKQPGQSPEKYAYAIDLLRHSLAIYEGPYNLANLGAGQFRMGEYKASLETLARAEAIDFVVQENHVQNLAFTAMAQEKLGRHADAHATLQKLIAIAEIPNALQNDDTLVFDEAATLIDAASTQPTTMPTTSPTTAP